MKRLKNSKVVKGIGVIIITVIIYYIMTNGFSLAPGDALGVNSSSSLPSDNAYSWQEYTVATVLLIGFAIAIVRQWMLRNSRKPKNDVNVKY